MKNIISLLCVGFLLLAVALGCNSRGNSYDTGFQTTEAEKKQEADRIAEEKQILRELEASDVFKFDGGLSALTLSGDTLIVKNPAITFKDVQAFKERAILPRVLDAKGIILIKFDNGKRDWIVSTK